MPPRGTALLPLLLLSALACAAPVLADDAVDVCVVGGGPAGIAAALSLASRNRTFALLERSDGVGGQAYAAYTDPHSGARVHLGAIIVLADDYPRVLALAARVGLGLEPYAVPFRSLDGATQADQPLLRVAAAAASPLLAAAARRFVDAYAAAAPALRARGGLPATLAAAPALAVPFDDWLRDIGAAALLPIAASMSTQYGYGHLHTLCAASFLNYFTPNMLRYTTPAAVSLAAGLQPVSKTELTAAQFAGDAGFAELFRRAAALLPRGALRLRVNITSVLRPPADGSASAGDAVTLRYAQAGAAAATTLRCGALLSTAAPTREGLAWLGLDAMESALFARVRPDRLFSTALLLAPPLPTPGAFALAPPARAVLASAARAAGVRGAARDGASGAQPAMPWASVAFDAAPWAGDAFAVYTVNPGAANRPAGAGGLSVAYSFAEGPGGDGGGATPADVAAKVRDAAARQLRGRAADVRAVVEWAYNPRPAPADAAAFYAAVGAAQGRRRTFHAGGAFTFWDVEQAMRSGQELVERFF